VFCHEGGDPLGCSVGPLVAPGGHLPTDIDVVDEEIVAVDGIGFAHPATVPRKPATARSTLQQTVDIGYGLDEVLALSGRIAVMFEGRIVAVMDTAEVTVERIGFLMPAVGRPLRRRSR
jgi:hypothetical protein